MEKNKFPVLLDSNVWIAYLNENDSQHKKADLLFETMKREHCRIIITEYILAEVATVLRLRAEVKKARIFLDRTLHNNDVTVLFSSVPYFFEVVRLFQKISRKNLSFVDISLLVLAKRFKVVTFDGALARELKAE